MVEMAQIVKQRVVVKMNSNDCITVKQASEVLGRQMDVICRWMDAGVLPMYVLPLETEGAQRVRKFTSRKACQKLREKFVARARSVGSYTE